MTAEALVPGIEPEVHVPARAERAPRLARRVGQRFRRNVVAMIGLVMLTLIVLSALLAPWLAPQDPAATDPFHKYASPSGKHWMGTDGVGRDTLSRLLYGGRTSLAAGALIVMIAILAGTTLGLTAGYFRGWWDAIVCRFSDALFAFPSLTLALAVTAVFKSQGLAPAAIAIAITFVPGFVRLVRAQVLAVREETYVEAARSVGIGERRMLLSHILPNAMTPLMVQIASSFGYALLAEAGLSFLGFGVQPPTASWGTMLENAYESLPDKSWPVFAAGILLSLTVLAINLVADGLRDALGREDYSLSELGS